MKENMDMYVHVAQCCRNPYLSDRSSFVIVEVLLRGQ